MCRDSETFISSDDFRINLWKLDYPTCAYNILDMKPKNIHDVDEAITGTHFCLTSEHLFSYFTSKGNICVCDLRVRS